MFTFFAKLTITIFSKRVFECRPSKFKRETTNTLPDSSFPKSQKKFARTTEPKLTDNKEGNFANNLELVDGEATQEKQEDLVRAVAVLAEQGIVGLRNVC